MYRSEEAENRPKANARRVIERAAIPGRTQSRSSLLALGMRRNGVKSNRALAGASAACERAVSAAPRRENATPIRQGGCRRGWGRLLRGSSSIDETLCRTGCISKFFL